MRGPPQGGGGITVKYQYQQEQHQNNPACTNSVRVRIVKAGHCTEEEEEDDGDSLEDATKEDGYSRTIGKEKKTMGTHWRTIGKKRKTLDTH